MPKPLVTIALAFLTGLLLADAFLFVPCFTALTLSIALAAGAWLFRRRIRYAGAALIVGSLLFAAAGYLYRATVLPPDHYAGLSPLDGSLREVTGKIVSPLERDPGRAAFILAVEHIGAHHATGKVRVVLKDERPAIGYGDRIAVSGKLYPVRGYRNPGGFDYSAHLGRQGVSAVLSVRKGISPRIIDRGSSLFRIVQDWRERIRLAFLRHTTGDGSAVLLAMILGEEGGLTSELRDIFLAAGATHILSISGSHLGLVALICFWIARNLLFLFPERLYHRMTLGADPRKISALLAILPVIFYALLAGGHQATVRSLIMLLTGFAALLTDRDHDLPQALALAALIVLAPAPQAVFDISFQLSYLSVAAIPFIVSTATAGLPAARTWRERIGRDALLLFAVSLAATAATAPLVAFYFNRVSPWGVLSNMIIVPFAGLIVVPLGLLSGVLSLVLGTLPFTGLNQAAADAFVSLASFFSRLPGAGAAFPAPGGATALLYAGLIGSLAWMARSWVLSRSNPLEYPARDQLTARRIAILAGILLALTVMKPFLGPGKDRITWIDVGQGDCALVETADGKRILIDGGGSPDNRFDVGQKVVAPFLWNRGIGAIDLAILSHPHPDHMNGLTSVLRLMPVREIWTSGRDRDLEGYEEFRKAAELRGAIIRQVQAGDRAFIGKAKIEVLHPGQGFDNAGRRAYETENNRSLVVRMSISDTRILFTGDIHREAERSLIASGADLQSELLKVPHHGSKTSSTEAFLKAVGPAIAVVSVAAGNPYRQPSDEIVERLNASGIRLYRTDRDGAVIVGINNRIPDVTAWTSLLLTPVTITNPATWWESEKENWRRIRIRRAVI